VGADLGHGRQAVSKRATEERGLRRQVVIGEDVNDIRRAATPVFSQKMVKDSGDDEGQNEGGGSSYLGFWLE